MIGAPIASGRGAKPRQHQLFKAAKSSLRPLIVN